ncbi:MAG: transcription elongation factor GreA [Gammaproteobacteria bacterium]|nr:transcription elongation factor GreA [Gammaproteobacteria bacterium]MYD79310.1 transcription elongation factor GreA [Gammaproteobacteria bacterium]
MTVEGERQLRQELSQLKNGRAEASRAIGEARKLGDLRENADYHAAKERQGMMEARIRYLETQLSSARIIDVTKISNTGTVIFGSTVTLQDTETGTDVRYRIVGEDEADIKSGTISNTAPLARAMIGMKQDDSFSVGEESMRKEYTIKRVEHI